MFRRKGFWIGVLIFMLVFMPGTLFLIAERVINGGINFINIGVTQLDKLPTTAP